MDKFLKLSTGSKLITIGSIMTVLSLFFHWGGWAGYDYTGLDFKAYLIILALIYPMYNVYKGQAINKKKAMISLIIGLLFIFYVRIVAFANVFGNVPGTYTSGGFKFAIAGIIVAIIGAALTPNQEVNK